MFVRKHFGHWLRAEIEQRLLTQEAFARHAGVPLITLQFWLAQASPRMRGINRERLRVALGMSRRELDRHLPSPARARARAA